MGRAGVVGKRRNQAMGERDGVMCQLQLRLAWWAEGSPRALQRRPPVPCTDQHYPRPGPLQAQPELFAATLAAGGQGKAAVEQQEFLESSMALMQVRAVACRQG